MAASSARGATPLSLSAWLRYDAIQRLLPANVSRVLEVGAGLGSLGALLADRFEYVGLEPDPLSYETAVRRVGNAGRVLNATAEEFTSSAPFDLVCAFEVLEHCENDVDSLTAWLRHLRPGGFAILSVPFGRDRFGSWDSMAGHYRRYDREDVVETMESAGLRSIATIAYGFPLGSALSVVRDLIARHLLGSARAGATMGDRTRASGRQLQPPDWAAPATRLVSAPFRVLQRPFSGTERGPGIVARGQLGDS